MVIVDLGIAPGFRVDAGDFAELIKAKKITKFSVTARQVTLYIGDVKPGEVKTFVYTLRPKYPVKAKTPATVAYEYYTPRNRGTAKPVVTGFVAPTVGLGVSGKSLYVGEVGAGLVFKVTP